MIDNTPRKAFDDAVSRLVDAVEAGDREQAVVELANAQAFAPAGLHEESIEWLAAEQRRVVDLSDELDAEPRGWGRRG